MKFLQQFSRRSGLLLVAGRRILALAVALAAAAPAQPAPIRQADLTLRDAARGKDLEVRVTYPEAPGRHPLVVFSHGLFGSGTNYHALADHWAARGYAVLRPTHSDSLRLRFRQGGGMPSKMAAVRDWKSRPADVAFLLDSTRRIEAAIPGLADRWDPAIVGLGGHSFGAQTTMLCGGVRTLAGDFTEPRIKALVMISPQGPGALLGDLEWGDPARPQLHVTGSEDGSDRVGQPASWRLEAFRRSPAPARFLLWIDGADHAFGGIGSDRRGVRRDPDHRGAVQAVTTAFWDHTLKGSAVARRFLEDDVVAGWTDGEARVFDAGDELPAGLPRWAALGRSDR